MKSVENSNNISLLLQPELLNKTINEYINNIASHEELNDILIDYNPYNDFELIKEAMHYDNAYANANNKKEEASLRNRVCEYLIVIALRGNHLKKLGKKVKDLCIQKGLMEEDYPKTNSIKHN